MLHVLSVRRVALGLHLLAVVVKVAAIAGVANAGDDGSFRFAVVDSFPVDVLEPRVCLDQRRPAFAILGNVPEALRGIDCAKTGDEILRVWRNT